MLAEYILGSSNPGLKNTRFSQDYKIHLKIPSTTAS